MAELLDTFPKRERGRPSKYDWETFLDGEIRRLNRQDDFPDVANAQTFRMMVYTAAKRKGMKVRTRVENNETLIIEQYE